MNEEELLKMLREAFKEEAVERLASLSNCLLQLERVAQDDVAESEPLEVAFREAHSLKGAARSVSLRDVEALFQALESVLSRMKRAELALEINHFDVMHDCVGAMETFLVSFADDSELSCHDAVAPLIEQLELLQRGELSPASVKTTVELTPVSASPAQPCSSPPLPDPVEEVPPDVPLSAGDEAPP
ncbi:MAG: Hpt domain-containing protein, partial [Thermodesulfobacteriota bacterium]|nr:Hpt domain-containing protein [Thermodesulfobacteriota bacterium]